MIRLTTFRPRVKTALFHVGSKALPPALTLHLRQYLILPRYCGHSIKPGLDPGLDSGLWTLDSGLWTLDSGLQIKIEKKNIEKNINTQVSHTCQCKGSMQRTVTV